MKRYKEIFQKELNDIEKIGLFKEERAIKTPQGTDIITQDHKNDPIFSISKISETI